MRCPGCQTQVKRRGLWSHLRKSRNSNCRRYLEENGQKLGQIQIQERRSTHSHEPVFDPAGDVFGDYNEYLEENSDSYMDVDQHREDTHNSEAEAETTDDEDPEELGLGGTELEPSRPQLVNADITLDDDDTGSDSESPNRVYDASYKLHNKPFVVPFPGAAGKQYGAGDLTEDEIYQNTIGVQSGIYAPFTSKMEWEIAKWAKERGPSSTAFTDLMTIEGVSEALNLSFKSSLELNKIIDEKIPCSRPRFNHYQVVVGSETCDVYFRNAIQCIQALLSDTSLSPQMIFAPEKHYTDDSKTSRMYHDMHTGKWWWATQKAIEENVPGATIIPIIISTDKTQLTLFRNKSAYPVYLTIGNIPKEIRRKPSARAYVLLGYLPTSKLENVTNKASRRRMVANLYHSCMGEILEPLQKPGEEGIMMNTADGYIRRMHPILAAFVGDYPEQVLTTCTYSGDCPCCDAPRNDLGNGDPGSGHLRDLDDVLDVLATFDTNPSEFVRSCKGSRIKPVFSPFWHHLPCLDIYNSITPDVLHQLYQGLIKHLVSWLISAFGPLEIDARCRRLPSNHNIRSFTKGITSLSHISGKEHDQISRILMGLIVGLELSDGRSAAPLVRSVRALLDFLFLAQYPVHTDETLGLLQSALDRFHENKDIFIHLGIRNNFNLPKLHFAKHYMLKIKHFGTTDNFNTEYTERLHIDLAKDAYRATNRKDEYAQMTMWLERKEKIARHERYIRWRLDSAISLTSTPREWITPGLSIDREMHVSKRPNVRRVVLDDFVAKYGATYFREAFARFITLTHYPNLSATQLERQIWGVEMPTQNFWVWHHIKFLSTDPFTLSTSTADTIHANSVAQRFDTALIRVNDEPKGIHDFRVGRIRAVFSMPPKTHQRIFPGGITPIHLVYVEWYTRFPRNPEPNHLMYKISIERDRSSASGHGIGSIIPLSDVVRSVHLFPAFGPFAPINWTSSSVLDHASTFYVNPFTDRHLYRLIG